MSLQLNYYLSERATNMPFFLTVLLSYSKYDKCKFQNTANLWKQKAVTKTSI